MIAGTRAAVEAANEALIEEGAKRALMLPVSVPSHSSLMKPAADDSIAAIQVSNYVNNANNEGARCIEPV